MKKRGMSKTPLTIEHSKMPCHALKTKINKSMLKQQFHFPFVLRGKSCRYGSMCRCNHNGERFFTRQINVRKSDSHEGCTLSPRLGTGDTVAIKINKKHMGAISCSIVSFIHFSVLWSYLHTHTVVIKS